ncbi:MAG TPA: RDD family protein [Cyclobacteriaceae bacterium]|jgi:uncharacterized RDD family membrane protein YckC|nr:RDD family protein [Cyclobacteriaceae bacterium]
MEEVLDQSLFNQPTDAKPANVKYAGFWSRFGALIIDGIILAPISFGLTYFNISSWKSTALLVLISLVGIGYKPYMELMYGATWGKMALKLTVTNKNFERANLSEILFRNVFHIVPQLISLLITISIYNNADFESVSGWGEFTSFSQQFPLLQYFNYASGSITIIDAIMLAADDQKRSLHDRIGGTFVIDQSN